MATEVKRITKPCEDATSYWVETDCPGMPPRFAVVVFEKPDLPWVGVDGIVEAIESYRLPVVHV